MSVDQANLNETTLALIAGISKKNGLEHYQIFEKSVNKAKFKQYLTGLRAANPDAKICLFMDNLKAHTAEASTKEMKRLGFRYILNVPYSPDYNPIELCFSQFKAKFKALRARKLMGLTNETHEELVKRAWNGLKKKHIVKCIEHTDKLLR